MDDISLEDTILKLKADISSRHSYIASYLYEPSRVSPGYHILKRRVKMKNYSYHTGQVSSYMKIVENQPS